MHPDDPNILQKTIISPGKTPGRTDSFNQSTCDSLQGILRLNFLQSLETNHTLMTLHYLAKRVRTEVLTAVSWCASRVLKPTEEDEKKLDHTLGYLQATKDRKCLLRVGDKVQLRAYVDASKRIIKHAFMPLSFNT